MRRGLLAAALLLPLLVLGHGIWKQGSALSGAEVWRIPITGYDPRDPLRGRYIQFRYAWKQMGDATLCEKPAGCRICLSRRAGEVVAEVVAPETGCPVIKDTLGYIECRVVGSVEHGDHTVFVAEVVGAAVHREGEPLLLESTGWNYGG